MNKCFVFDFDDTIATTTARIIVKSKHPLQHFKEQTLEYLTPSQFSSYELKEGEWFDFNEFRDSKFIQNANPTFLIHLAQEVDNEGHDVYILTAREDDSSDAIAEFLSQFNVHPKTIHCVGGTKETIPQRKHDILMMLIRNYSKVYFYDDCKNNIDNAPEHENFRKYKV